jgi:hypothetical protein
LTRRTGRAFLDVVNETLRRVLAPAASTRARRPFRVDARELGPRRPGAALDNVAELLDRVEGPSHR